MANQFDNLMAVIAKSHCSKCKLRQYAERKPDSFITKLWRWHAGWCPVSKVYERNLAKQQNAT